MSKKIRIKDIAERAGVSPGTVDRVLHNRGNVAPDVKAAVQEIMNELGYERNILASTLASKKTYRLVALLPDYSKDVYWEQPHAGVQYAAKAVHPYGAETEVLFFNLFDPDSFTAVTQQVLEQQPMPDGLLFPPIFLQEGAELVERCRTLQIPAVLINTRIKSDYPLSYIGQDSYQSGVLAGRLLNFGLQDDDSVLVLNLEKQAVNAQHLIEKERGFRDYFSGIGRHSIGIQRLDFASFDDPVQMKSFIRSLLETVPRLAGVFVTNSRAYKLVEALPQEVARRVKITGFDLVSPNIRYLYESKIDFIINQNPVEQGYRGLMALFKHIVLKEETDRVAFLPLDIVVAENVEYYLKKQEPMMVVG